MNTIQIIKVLSWLITAFSVLNFLGILASLSSREKILLLQFLSYCSWLVFWSRFQNQSHI